MITENITVSEAINLHKQTKEAYDFASNINTTLSDKLKKMTTSQQSIVIEAISSYFRAIELTWYFNLENKK